MNMMPLPHKKLLLLAIILILVFLITSCVIVQPRPSSGQIPSSRETRSNQVDTLSQLRIEEPLPDNRFLVGEPVRFKARLTNDKSADTGQLSWRSSLDGNLGTGTQIQTDKLTAGTHEIVVSYGKSKGTVQIRVFRDLWQLYQSAPSQDEINQIQSDFTLNWIDGNKTDEKWMSYTSFKFDQKSADPSKIIAIEKLDLLRHQKFSQPLPFTNGKSLYEHLQNYVDRVNLSLGCNINTAGGKIVNLNRQFSIWDIRQSATAEKPDACKIPLTNPPVLNEYINSLYLFIHEARHCEPSDSGHVECQGKDNMDTSLEPGSGHARAVLYLMWVYKYGIYDPPSIKEQAKQIAMNILKSRFCSTVKHNNPQVQAILKELLGG